MKFEKSKGFYPQLKALPSALRHGGYNTGDIVTIETHLGSIRLTKKFFSKLIGDTVTGCFGVADMNDSGVKQTFIETLPFFGHKRYVDKGISVRVQGASLYIDLHVTVVYGVNVATVVESVREKVRYIVEEETDLTVEQVNVYVDKIISD